jgi:hypothetical protein
MPVAARIVGDTDQAASHAALDVTAEPSGTARLDGAHDATFGAAKVAGMSLGISLTVAAEDVRRLQHGHGCRAAQEGGVPSILNRSNGLMTLPIVVAATWV